MKAQLTKEQKTGAAIAAKITKADELSEFMDRVEQRLNEYDKAAEDLVVARPTKKYHS